MDFEYDKCPGAKQWKNFKSDESILAQAKI